MRGAPAAGRAGIDRRAVDAQSGSPASEQCRCCLADNVTRMVQNRRMAAVPTLIATTLSIQLPEAFAGAQNRPPTRYAYGPPDLKEVCAGEICHRFGKISAPLDHADPSQGEWELTYFVNSDYWDPLVTPDAPIFINMGYGSTDVGGWTASGLRQVDGATFNRGFVGTSVEFAREMGALVINVPNRYYGCETARAGNSEGCCPTSLEQIPTGETGVIEAHERLRFLSLRSVVDDIALVATATITHFAQDWGMDIHAGSERARNQPIVFGCSWPGAAAVYARMLYPDLFAGAVATSHPLVSSPDGNNHYRSFLGSVYELYSAGGSLECKNVVEVGHQEIQRRLETTGEQIEPVGSCIPSGSGSCCIKDCVISEEVNSDFGLSPDEWHTFGIGVPGLPRVQTIERDCETFGCNIELTCSFLLECFADSTDSLGLTFPVKSEDPRAAEAAYECLKSFSSAVRSKSGKDYHQATKEQESRRNNVMTPRIPSVDEEFHAQKEMMVFDATGFDPANDLGPRVYQSSTLTYFMFGWRGPLWMTQTCNDGSGCPFVQGTVGGGTTEQINAIIWASYALPGESLEDFTEQMRHGASVWHDAMGGQRPWLAVPGMSRVYNVYNDADPWTAPGISRHMPAGRNLTYDLGGGGVSHCVYNAEGAQESIKLWSTPSRQK